MSEQKSEPASAEIDSRGIGPVAPEASPEPAQAAADVGSPDIAPNQEETAPTADAPRVEPKLEAPKAEATQPEPPRIPGNVTIMSPGDRADAAAKVEAEPAAAKRRVSAMAAMIALATVAGAIGGALATAGVGHLAAGNDTASARNVELEASVARLDADILALKASVEQNAKASTGQLNKTSDRLDKVEKAQGEPAAKLAKLGEAVEKLRKEQAATAVAAPAPATPAAMQVASAAKDITGSLAPPATAVAAPAAAAPATPTKPEIARLPTVEGWVLRDVGRGGAGALIESRRGIYEVYPGEPVPGLGRVDAIRKQDGRWVVVTTKGLIVSR